VTYFLRVPAVLCVVALALSPFSADAQVIRPHAVPEAFGALVMPLSGAALQPAPPKRDSLKNGAIIGGAVGGITMLALSTLACAALTGLKDGGGCGSGIALATALGVGIGAGAGIGVDALLQRSPHARIHSHGRNQVGVGVRMRF
jgi:hypothetical protein